MLLVTADRVGLYPDHQSISTTYYDAMGDFSDVAHFMTNSTLHDKSWFRKGLPDGGRVIKSRHKFDTRQGHPKLKK
jgi:hypothetical protein